MVNILTNGKVHESWTHLISAYTLLSEQSVPGLIPKYTQIIYPPVECVFKVFEMNVKDIKVVLLGQDPYYTFGQAHGLSFSVPDGVRIPMSLRNIFKEIQYEFPERDYIFTSGNLEKWFYEQKIFLLNSALTVKSKKPGSQIKQWSSFTDTVINYILEQNKDCVFLLMGNFAKKKMPKDNTRVVTCAHPSPLSAHKGFFQSNVFKKIEDLLGQTINWQN